MSKPEKKSESWLNSPSALENKRIRRRQKKGRKTERVKEKKGDGWMC